MDTQSVIQKLFDDSCSVKQQTVTVCSDQIAEIGAVIVSALKDGKKLLIFGNGGSASDAQHAAGEFVGRFLVERRALPAIALTADTAILTCISNDYCFEDVFARQVEALANPGDVAIGISTSGNSKNVIRAIQAAKSRGVHTVGMTGQSGGKLRDECEVCLCIPSPITARIQETHILVWHVICTLVDNAFS